jgi:hypothetical protein
MALVEAAWPLPPLSILGASEATRARRYVTSLSGGRRGVGGSWQTAPCSPFIFAGCDRS